jgi:hypothetical protein
MYDRLSKKEFTQRKDGSRVANRTNRTIIAGLAVGKVARYACMIGFIKKNLRKEKTDPVLQTEQRGPSAQVWQLGRLQGTHV